jgi:hypothetical protein
MMYIFILPHMAIVCIEHCMFIAIHNLINLHNLDIFMQSLQCDILLQGDNRINNSMMGWKVKFVAISTHM